MSDESQSGAPKKLSTKDILAAARAAAAAKAEAEGAAPAGNGSSVPAPAEAAPAAAESAAAPAKPAGKPSSTADILAAARAAAAQKAAGGEAPAADKPAAPKPAAPAAGGAKPKSTADILAAARAAKAGGAAPAASAPAGSQPAAAKAAAKTSVAAADAPQLSVQEMLAAVRPAGVAAAVAAPPAEKKPVKVAPPMPTKPAPVAKKGAAPNPERRFVLLTLLFSPFAMAWVMLSGAATAALLGVARFMLPNVLTEPPRKFKIGPPTDYDLGTVATKWVAGYGVWIVHTDQYKGKNMIYALASVCTHLGCTPSWLEGEQKFKCPCHGSGFYITGVNFEGPAPRPLERVGLRLAEDGMLEVDKSLKFQEEMGQWEDGNSYYEPVA